MIPRLFATQLRSISASAPFQVTSRLPPLFVASHTHLIRPFTMSAPAEATHKDPVTGEMVSKS